MAEAKTSSKRAKPKTRSSSKPKRARPASKSKPSKASSNGRSKPPRAASKSKPSSRSKSSSSSPKGSAGKSTTSKPQAALEAVEGTAKSAGSTVSRVASKAKVPLMAGGAALAAGAGGLALGAHQAHRKGGLAGKVNGKDIAKAARKVGDVGAQVGEVALEVRRARESTNGHGKVHRSPIEVVLQGLTQRHPRD